MTTAEHRDALAELRDQLQPLQDRQEITDLISRLGRWLDEKRFDEAPAIFTDDVTVETAGGASRGIARVVDQARRNHTRRTHHMVTNTLIDLGLDAAHIEANLVVRFAPDHELPVPSLTLGERYRLEAVRTGHGWRLRRVAAQLIWRDGELPTPPRQAA